MPRASQNLGAWVLLMIIMQLTLWVRASSAAENDATNTEAAAAAEESTESSAQNASPNAKVDSGADDPCRSYTNCGSCAFSRYQYSQSTVSSSPTGLGSRPTCHWCTSSSTCYSPSKRPDQYCIDHKTNQSLEVTYEYNCPLGPVPYPDNPPTLLPNWMGEFYEAGLLDDNVTLTDLSLPGTHDSLTYDLSLTVSEDGIDSLQEIAKLLHTLSGGKIKILPGELEEFFRMQAKTQQLTITQQLDNGVRFLDFRIMWEKDKNAWYSIHFMQSKQKAEEYLLQIRKWLEEHPQEVIVIWLSKHGITTATGQDQYPGVNPDQKHQFWNKYCQIFRGLMQANNETSIFETPLAELIRNNHRVITMVSDYQEFTQSSTLALDAALIQNKFDGGVGVFEEDSLIQQHIDYFKNASVNNARINAQNGFTLLAMNTASPSWQVISAAKHQFLHWLGDNPQQQMRKRRQLRSKSYTDQKDLQSSLFHSCSSHIKIPGVDHWCPQNLLDISQLASFYNQIAIEEAYQHSFDEERTAAAFPNAFYIDVLDYDGTIRVGPQLMDGSDRGDDRATKETKYALVDTLLAYNARAACKKRKRSELEAKCQALMGRIITRRSKHPLRRWKEPSLGRHEDWPRYSYDSTTADSSK